MRIEVPTEAVSIEGLIQQPGMRTEVPTEAVSVEGLIRIDVTVTDRNGHVVSGLQRGEFKVLDNGALQQIVAFRQSSGNPARPDDPLTLILVIDTLDVPVEIAAFERERTADFLRRNSGHLGRPVAVYSLEDSGFFLTARASTDGEELARAVASDKKSDAFLLPLHEPSKFDEAPVERFFNEIPGLTGLRALGSIATAEDMQPGRKLVLWIGPGLSENGTGAYIHGILPFSPEVERDVFDKIQWFSTLLRQARVVVDCLSVLEDAPASDDEWTEYLNGVPSARQASWMNLYKKVLAVQSGGRVLPPTNDLSQQLTDCIKDAEIYYTLTFDPPQAAHADEYHSLRIELSQPDLIAHTSSAYYNQPFYDDPPDPSIRPLTVSQLEEFLRSPIIAKELRTFGLTERLSGAKLGSLSAHSRGKKLHESLEIIAAESAFLDPPSSEIIADPSPSQAEQQRMLASATDYLNQIIPRLPDFFAIRTAIYYREVALYPGTVAKIAEPLHPELQSYNTVLYRQGDEIVEPSRGRRRRGFASSPGTPAKGETNVLSTHGTFGPMVILLQSVLKGPGSTIWKWWQIGLTGREAVFSFTHTGHPSVTAPVCCSPGNGEVKIDAGYHGKFAIDPSSGAILRIQVEFDLKGFVPTNRSNIMVSYGPVQIGGKTYILPLRSVTIERERSLTSLPEWNLSFPTWGPYQSSMNVFTFDRYREFRGTAHMLPVPDF